MEKQLEKTQNERQEKQRRSDINKAQKPERPSIKTNLRHYSNISIYISKKVVYGSQYK